MWRCRERITTQHSRTSANPGPATAALQQCCIGLLQYPQQSVVAVVSIAKDIIYTVLLSSTIGLLWFYHSCTVALPQLYLSSTNDYHTTTEPLPHFYPTSTRPLPNLYHSSTPALLNLYPSSTTGLLQLYGSSSVARWQLYCSCSSSGGVSQEYIVIMIVFSRMMVRKQFI